jgi:putative membrane protein
MKRIKIQLLLCMGVVALASCKAPEANVATATDRLFIESAQERLLLDGQMGQVARTRATSEEVRRFGEILLRNNILVMEELQVLAEKKSVTLPVTLSAFMQEEFNELIQVPDERFDEKFVSLVLSSRQRAIALYEQQIKLGRDNEIRSWASGKMTGLYQEKERANELKQRFTRL